MDRLVEYRQNKLQLVRNLLCTHIRILDQNYLRHGLNRDPHTIKQLTLSNPENQGSKGQNKDPGPSQSTRTVLWQILFAASHAP